MAQVAERFHTLSDQIKTIEAANINADLMAATVDYAKTRPVFDEYKAAKYSRKYYAEYVTDIELHRAARATFQHKDDLGEKYFSDLLEYLFEFILNGISKGD